ncbi:MAG TPA: hypothetical protein VFY06_12315 [Verrucomicrobiae bacterium]|nr:hypothetical protein [Verrucomicrobiae bacterium]
MNLNAGEVLKPVFDFLDTVIADYGVYLFVVLVWVSVIVLVWVFSGGLRRKYSNQPHVRAGIGIVIQSPKQPLQPTPILFQDEGNDEV